MSAEVRTECKHFDLDGFSRPSIHYSITTPRLQPTTVNCNIFTEYCTVQHQGLRWRPWLFLVLRPHTSAARSFATTSRRIEGVQHLLQPIWSSEAEQSPSLAVNHGVPLITQRSQREITTWYFSDATVDLIPHTVFFWQGLRDRND